MKKLISYLLVLVFSISVFSGCLYSEHSNEEPAVCPDPTATRDPAALERRFADNRLWLVIKKEYHDHIFTREDFPDVDIAELKNDLGSEKFTDEDRLNCINYTVFLNENSKEAVLEVCDALKKYDTVEDALPEYYPEEYDGPEFAVDHVTILIKPEYKDHVYTMDDFPEIDGGILTYNEFWIEDPENNLDQLTYRMILPVHSAEAVLNACEVLKKRQDVFSADPGYYGTYFSVPIT